MVVEEEQSAKSGGDLMIKLLAGLAALLVVVVVAIGAFLLGRENGSDDSTPVAIGEVGDYDYAVLNEVRELLDQYYVRPENLDDQSLFEAAVNGMLAILNDTGTFYVTPEDYQTSTVLTGSFEGIGATVSTQGNDIVIVAPIKDTPAERAGLVSGDVIRAVDGEDTTGWTVEKAVLRIRGPRGTDVTLTIEHADGTLEDLTITRDTVQVQSVQTVPPGGVLRNSNGDEVDDIGYVQIQEFSRRTAQEVEDAVNAELDRGIKGLILDVRYNGGGLLDTTVSIADLFLNGEIVLYEREADGDELPFKSREGELAPGLPIVILQNRFSASASEVLAAALRENDRATIIGETSFGKGTVNSPRELSDGGALYVTIAEWLTPSGTLINNVGI
ncbi:MAG TPA: S41 family peptidase, partial [Dehalococcoidia bacterium]|nr:S41 family peptidase [Dehalococcoidia bacterium]